MIIIFRSVCNQVYIFYYPLTKKKERTVSYQQFTNQIWLEIQQTLVKIITLTIYTFEHSNMKVYCLRRIWFYLYLSRNCSNVNFDKKTRKKKKEQSRKGQ